MPKLSGKHAVYGVLLLASIAFLLYSVQSARTGAGAGEGLAAGRTGDAGEQRIAAIPAAVPDDVDFGRYRDLARTNIFSDQRASAAPKVTQTVKGTDSLPKFTRDPVPPPATDTAAPKQPAFAGWTYAGYVLVNGEKRGLLQNDSSDTGKDFAVGDKFLGATVEEVTGQTIRLRSGKVVTTLRISDQYPIVPLDNSASAAAPQRPRVR